MTVRAARGLGGRRALIARPTGTVSPSVAVGVPELARSTGVTVGEKTGAIAVGAEGDDGVLRATPRSTSRTRIAAARTRRRGAAGRAAATAPVVAAVAAIPVGLTTNPGSMRIAPPALITSVKRSAATTVASSGRADTVNG